MSHLPEANLREAESFLSFTSAQSGTLHTMRLLLVEDEPTLAESICRGLRAEGLAVDWEADGADGLWRATEGAYDAIVLDIMLPSMNGYEICRQLRADEIWTPILMLTAKDGTYDEAEAFEFGADDYLRKPFSHVVLVARLRALTRRAQTHQGRTQAMTLGELQLDAKTLKVTNTTGSDNSNSSNNPNSAVELTPREFAVLEALVRRAPHIVAKSELLDAVWGMDFDGDPNIAEVYVGYVRRKLLEITDKPIIKTVRGVGYQAQR